MAKDAVSVLLAEYCQAPGGYRISQGYYLSNSLRDKINNRGNVWPRMRVHHMFRGGGRQSCAFVCARLRFLHASWNDKNTDKSMDQRGSINLRIVTIVSGLE